MRADRDLAGTTGREVLVHAGSYGLTPADGPAPTEPLVRLGVRSVVEDDPHGTPVPLHPVIGMGYNQDVEWLRSPDQVDVPASGAANLDLAAANRSARSGPDQVRPGRKSGTCSVYPPASPPGKTVRGPSYVSLQAARTSQPSSALYLCPCGGTRSAVTEIPISNAPPKTIFTA